MAEPALQDHDPDISLAAVVPGIRDIDVPAGGSSSDVRSPDRDGYAGGSGPTSRPAPRSPPGANGDAESEVEGQEGSDEGRSGRNFLENIRTDKILEEVEKIRAELMELEKRNEGLSLQHFLECPENFNSNGSTRRGNRILGWRCRSYNLTKKLARVRVLDLPSTCLHVNKKVLVSGVILLGLLFTFLFSGALIGVFNHSLSMTSGSINTAVFPNYRQSQSRMLIANDQGDKGGANSSAMTSFDELYVRKNGKYVKINYNLIADEKALAHWISHNKSPQSGKHQEETVPAEGQNGKDKPHLPAHKKLKTTVVSWIAITSAIFAVLCSIAVLLWCKCRKRVQQNDQIQDETIFQLELCVGMGPKRFRHNELAAATNNFSDDNKLGQGGFGPVYRGYLTDLDRHVAIKVLSQETSGQGLKEFKAEVKVMTQLRHKNIVQLLGWCSSLKGLLLVYELMPEGSLDNHIYDPEKMLTWQERYKIAIGLGSGLLYLHEECEKCIVHGDIKPANVMLDIQHNAKLGDFGLARLIEHGAEPQTTKVVAGTPGYIDPEFINNRWPRTEPASRQQNGASALLAWVRDLYDQSMILDAADRRLNGAFDHKQMERVLVTGLWCAQHDPSRRPSIAEAMDVLRSADAKLPVLPAMRDAQHIRSLEEQAYGNLPVEDPSVEAVGATTYLTSKDSAYLLADE
ncbi:hypothetical protein ACP70R_003844 [Stipagrostis hirtigluma subsp. patula]